MFWITRQNNKYHDHKLNIDVTNRVRKLFIFNDRIVEIFQIWNIHVPSLSSNEIFDATSFIQLLWYGNFKENMFAFM